MTKGYPDWLRAFLLLGKYGASYLPVLLDANGNLYAVIKGDKGAGVLANVAVDADGQLIMVPRGQSGVYLNVDADGYLGAILKAAAEVTIPGGVDVTQTSTLRQVQGKDGVTYRDLAVDANGQIIMVPRGQGGNYLAVDADGNLTTVIKGDYEGALRTVKLDDAGRLSAFVIDSVDAWGKMLTIGNAELAARIVGWPVSYDRRGQILFYEQFDHGLGAFFSSVSGGGEAALFPYAALQGGYCLRMMTPASANAYATIVGNFPLTVPTTSLGLGVFFALPGEYTYLTLMIEYQDGANDYNATVKLTKSDKKIWLLTSNGAYTEVGTWTPSAALAYNWYYCKFVFDLATRRYKRIIIQGAEIDVSSYSCFMSATTWSRLIISISLRGAAAGDSSCLIDCITLTTQEP